MNHQHLFGTIKNSLSHPIFRKCYRVECYGWNGSLNTEEMNFIRRNIDLRHGFKVRCQCEESFNKELVSIGLFLFSKHKILFSYSIPEIEIVHAQLISSGDFKGMKCKIVRLWRHSFTPKGLNQVIRLWLSSDIPNLRRLRMNEFLQPANYEEALQEFNYKPWDGLIADFAGQ